MKFVGDRHLRKEDPRLLTGRGRYVGDITLPGMLHVVLLRSPHAHARIRRVDAARAREHPGVADSGHAFGDLGAPTTRRASSRATAACPDYLLPHRHRLEDRLGVLLARGGANLSGEARTARGDGRR